MQKTPPPRPLNKSAPPSDIFLEKLQGPAVTVTLGTSTKASKLSYTLPQALLSLHSTFFRAEIEHLTICDEPLNGNGKRNRSPSTDQALLSPKKKPENDTTITMTEQTKDEDRNHIVLADVDPIIFGLFLRFIYQGSYPSHVDTQPSFITVGSHGYMPKNYPPHASAPSMTINVPASIQAWLLGERLGATSFMNHCIMHIYSSIGAAFAITPSLISYIWTYRNYDTPSGAKSAQDTISSNTALPLATRSPTPLATSNASTPMPIESVTTTSPSPTPTPLAANHNSFTTTNQLRRLLIDVLTIHWPSPAGNIIAKSASLNTQWNILFDTHPALRHQFIFGLQGGIKLMPVQGYFTSGPTAVVAGQGQAAPVIKVEGEDEVKGLSGGKVDGGSGREGRQGVIANGR